MTTYNTLFLDIADPLPRRDGAVNGIGGGGSGGDPLVTGNQWHSKMGFQKPNNIDQSILQIKASEYAPFIREPEQPSVADMYLRQQFGGMRRMQQEQQEYGAEEGNGRDDLGRATTRNSNSPDRGGLRRPGPEWGNTHFGTKPRRRSIVEAETRAILDDNAPPTVSLYDELIAEEKRLAHLEAAPAPSQQGALINPILANGPVGSAAPISRPILDHPKAVRVSNYSESRWPEVLRALAPCGTILERFEELRHIPYYVTIPNRVLAESDDDVVRQARVMYTGDGWTKITFARREAAEEALSMNKVIRIGGRDLVIEPWRPDIHGRPASNVFRARPQAQQQPPVQVGGDLSMFATSTEVVQPGGIARRHTGFDQQQYGNAFAPPVVPATPAPSGAKVNQEPMSTPGGSQLSTQMRGAKVVQLKQVQFKKQPGYLSKLMSWVWGEVGPLGGHSEGWVAWFTNWLFGKL